MMNTDNAPADPPPKNTWAADAPALADREKSGPPARRAPGCRT